MHLISGVTEKGTIWIKNMNPKGKVATKRVLRLSDNVQFDTIFHPNGRPAYGLVTDFKNNKQFAKIYHLEENWFSKLMNKIKRREPIPTKELPAIDMDELLQEGTKGYFAVGYYQGSTGYTNPELNELTQKLKSSYLNQMFR